MVKVSSARQLTTDVKDRLLKLFKSQSVEFIVDKTLIGGIKVDTGNQVFDATVEKSITDLQKHLLVKYAE